MDIYTKKGDRGTTGVSPVLQLPKSDQRVNAIGDIDELISHLELIKSQGAGEFYDLFTSIQCTLDIISKCVASGEIGKNNLPPDRVSQLEAEIDRLAASFAHGENLEVRGRNTLSAQINVARAIARRAERSVCAVNKRAAINPTLLQYMNRLSDLLLVAACKADEDMKMPEKRVKQEPAVNNSAIGTYEQGIINAVLEKLGGAKVMTLEKAKKLTDAVIEYAESQGKRIVVAVCNSEGNPISVQVMDGAFLVSFDVAVRKAYTAVAVQMPTIELAKIIQPGETFYGLQKLDKIMPLGGGVPLRIGNTIVGGLGISGGTGEEDHALCEYALGLFESII